MRIDHIFCPTDLSPRSQAVLAFAAGIAERMNAKLSACHCASSLWFTPGQHMPDQRRAEIVSQMGEAVLKNRAVNWNPVVFEKSLDPAADILAFAREQDVDLIVMKARRSVFSALHFGSIVERVTRGAQVPVLLLPSRFVESIEDSHSLPNFREVLFDYDFSETTDKLFPTAMALTSRYRANLHLLSVLEPPPAFAVEAAQFSVSKTMLSAMRHRLDHIVGSASSSGISSPATVEWGDHAETVLAYAAQKNVDLICTTLSPPYYYFEKLYCAYLGRLLRSAQCPILTLRSV
jgi:nucleotide-binding universal stress UspA family protein